jgi:phage baseplate assembly protein W
MPIPVVTRIDPRDLDKNKAVGISLPFNGGGVFNKTYSTQDQIKSNLINLLLTDKGERIMNPEFGADIRKSLFDNITDSSIELLKNKIINAVNMFIPEIYLGNIDIMPDYDYNTLNITINYRLIISNHPDQVTVQFI